MGGSYQHNFRPTCLVDGGQTRGRESDLVVLEVREVLVEEVETREGTPEMVRVGVVVVEAT